MRSTDFPKISLVVLALVIVLAEFGTAQDDLREPPKLRSGVPHIAVGPAADSVTKEERERIANLIDQLAEIKNPDYGFAPWMSGVQFAPIKDSGAFGMGVIMIDHGLKTNETLERLVALGPKAIPQLLDHLTDKTSTQLVLEHKDWFGSQWYGHEVALNLAHPIEKEVLARYATFFKKSDVFGAPDSHIRRHEVTIGDVCFVIIGQIVNREYQSARYQPTACRVINSPTHDTEIAAIVQTIWTSEHTAQHLLDSLLLDYSTADDRLQCGAAMRLLYYFPDETAELIARRITEYHLGKSDDDGRRIFKKDGLRIEGFLAAVRTSSHPAITDALLGVIRHVSNPETFNAAISEGVAKRAPDEVFERMKQIIIAAASSEDKLGDGCGTLQHAASLFPDRSQELFEIYRRRNTPGALRSTIQALRSPAAPRDWMVQFLAAALDDKREAGWRYGPTFDSHPTRICDEAAEVLADHYLPDAQFKFEKGPAYLDGRIEKLKRVLAGDKDVSFDDPEQPVLPSELPLREALRVVEVDERINQLCAISTDEIVWARHGSCSVKGCALETWKIDLTTGTITDRIPLDLWKGGVSFLDNGPADRLFAYHGNEGGDVLIRDVRTGHLLKKVSTPFHDGIGANDPLQVRCLSDITMCGVNGQWIVAITPDGALHSIDTETGQHQIEWQLKSDHPEIHGVRGTSKVLLEGVGGRGLLDVPIKIWDQSTRKLETIEKVPYGGWCDAWGSLSWNNLNGHATLWNLAKRREIKLPVSDTPVVKLDCNQDQSRVFALRGDGTVEVFSVTDGIRLVPLVRLRSPVEETMNVSMVVGHNVAGNEGNWLFWLGQPPDQTDNKGRPIEVPSRTVIAVFRYADVPD